MLFIGEKHQQNFFVKVRTFGHHFAGAGAQTPSGVSLTHKIQNGGRWRQMTADDGRHLGLKTTL